MCDNCDARGGICTSPDHCICNNGWKGESCSEPICSIKCENGGNCIEPNRCECPLGFEGEYCEAIKDSGLFCAYTPHFISTFSNSLTKFKRNSGTSALACVTKLFEDKHVLITFSTLTGKKNGNEEALVVKFTRSGSIRINNKLEITESDYRTALI